jgi:L-alanine-DL-glutamate epimerase-like enolase superfamily enzyme
LLVGRDADLIESHWQTMWWGLHYGGRGGAQAWPCRPWTSRSGIFGRAAGGAALARAGRLRPARAVLAGGIDLDFPLDALLRQTDENLARGFRAIKMKVGRPSLATTSSACGPCGATSARSFR